MNVFDGEVLQKHPEVTSRLKRFLTSRPELTAFIHDPEQPGVSGRLLTSVMNQEKLRRVLGRMLDENEFLSPYGIRSLSRFHEEHPFVLHVSGQEYRVPYLPAESDTGMFGGTRIGAGQSGCR